ncbi:MAG: hypothetical protein GWP09_00405 [Nitrospiraceae bacterium]|nr:hypothetical protein [Nitrospiraceae bacterium]
MRCWNCGKELKPENDVRPYLICECGAVSRNPNFWDKWYRKRIGKK